MKIRPLPIDGAYELTPQHHEDARGRLHEMYRADTLTEAVGHPMPLAQVNVSTSVRGVIRGVHFADVPPGQVKYVTCLSGSVLDVVVDLRTGSPAFGHHAAVPLDDVTSRALYIAEGLGHAFCVTSDSATVLYLCSTPYTPRHEHGISPLDPDLSVAWPTRSPILSPKDRDAPTLAEARATGLLPEYDDGGPGLLRGLRGECDLGGVVEAGAEAGQEGRGA